MSPEETPARSAATSTACTTPSAGLGVLGTFASTDSSPSRDTSSTSVNVPPTSTPTTWLGISDLGGECLPRAGGRTSRRG